VSEVKLIVLWGPEVVQGTEVEWCTSVFPSKEASANGERGAEEGKEEARHLKNGNKKTKNIFKGIGIGKRGGEVTIESVNGVVGH
jgi:hypothetical protein